MITSFTKKDWAFVTLFFILVTFVSTSTLLLSLESHTIHQAQFVITSRLAACANALKMGSLDEFPHQKKVCEDALYQIEAEYAK